LHIDLRKTLKLMEKNLPPEGTEDIGQLDKLYELAMRFRSQILAVKYDMLDFGSAKRKSIVEAASDSQTEPKSMVTLIIPEPLPARKELTSSLEDHWIREIHKEIARESQTGIPYFEKAFVMIRIYAPRGTNNAKVWDTSNRAINVVINNLKGIFFDDDNFEHMACGIVADWGESGRTEIRICDLEVLKKCEIFR